MKKKKTVYFKKKMGYVLLSMVGMLTVGVLQADQLVHKFGSPAFNGQNQSAHYLTIDEQERTRQEKIAEDIQDVL